MSNLINIIQTKIYAYFLRTKQEIQRTLITSNILLKTNKKGLYLVAPCNLQILTKFINIIQTKIYSHFLRTKQDMKFSIHSSY